MTTTRFWGVIWRKRCVESFLLKTMNDNTPSMKQDLKGLANAMTGSENVLKAAYDRRWWQLIIYLVSSEKVSLCDDKKWWRFGVLRAAFKLGRAWWCRKCWKCLGFGTWGLGVLRVEYFEVEGVETASCFTGRMWLGLVMSSVGTGQGDGWIKRGPLGFWARCVMGWVGWIFLSLDKYLVERWVCRIVFYLDRACTWICWGIISVCRGS